ncbi:MAG: hypothetical protein EXQ87_00480 [Alphaproteobacteria bacterium]|nr:hypothetical protein [Alphaproteobacteria bacterium]
MAIETGDPVTAIPEDSATGDIADLFTDIRHVTGVQVVNLVWRHIALLPGALACSWAAVRPIYESGAAMAAGNALRRRLPLPDLPSLSRAALEVLGIFEAEEVSILNVLDSYNRSNAVNLAALTTLLLKLDGKAAPGPPSEPRSPNIEAPLGPLPKLLALAEMAPATAALVQQIDRLGARLDDGVLASMYRHLAHWPGFLALAHTLLTPLAADGRLTEAIRAAAAASRVEADALLDQLGPMPSLPTDIHDKTRTAMTMFVRGPIGRMVPICALLRRAMPPE